MAEATTEGTRSSESKFYCHQCSTEILPKLPEFTCPTCDGGFIEQITREFARNDTPEDGAQHTAHPFQLFRPLSDGGENSFLRMMPGPDDAELDSDEESDDFTDAAASANISQASFPRARISVRTVGGAGGADGRQAFQGLLEQILTSLTGGGRGGGNLLFGMSQGPGQFGLFNMGGLAGNPGDYAWGPGGLDSIITQLMNQLEGTGPPPASAEKIENLLTVNIKNDHVENNVQCSVCFEEFKLDEEVRQLPCQHMYHTDCIKPWLQMHGTCPVCRKTLEGEDTTCDENTQSIPQTLENMGLDTSAMSPRQESTSQSQQAAANGSPSSTSFANSAASRHSNMDSTRGDQRRSRDPSPPECD